MNAHSDDDARRGRRAPPPRLVEIEGVLMRRPEAVEVACAGVPDPIRGEEVVAYVVVEPEAAVSEADLLVHCAESLPPAKLPKRILFRTALPKTGRGKLDRKVLTVESIRDAGARGV